MSEHELGLLYAIYNTEIYGKNKMLNSIEPFIEYINEINAISRIYNYKYFSKDIKLSKKSQKSIINRFKLNRYLKTDNKQNKKIEYKQRKKT